MQGYSFSSTPDLQVGGPISVALNYYIWFENTSVKYINYTEINSIIDSVRGRIILRDEKFDQDQGIQPPGQISCDFMLAEPATASN